MILEGWTRPAAGLEAAVRRERAEAEAGIAVLQRLLAGAADAPRRSSG